MTINRDENGQALIITVLCMTCLLGFTALATDVGVMLREKRLTQTAADAAAIAGALEINYSSSNIAGAGLAAAGQNGFTSASSGVTTTGGTTVTINSPPSSGPHAGATNNNYVEAIVTQKQPAIFMGLFGFSSMDVSARAVAVNGGSSYGCVYALAPTGTGMSLQGKFSFDASNCGIVVDSSDPNAALSFTGNAGTITAGSLGVVGGVSGSSSGTQPIAGVVPQSDPLGYLDKSFPTPPSVCPAGGTLTGTISPGCYSGAVTLKDVTLKTGMYIFTGNVTLSGSVTTGAGGATLDINNGTLAETTKTTLNLTAAATGTFRDIAIMAPPSNTNSLSFDVGKAGGSITGIVYAPGATLSLQDNGSHNKQPLSLTVDLIVGKVDSGPSSITIQSFSQAVPGSPLTRVALVE